MVRIPPNDKVIVFFCWAKMLSYIFDACLQVKWYLSQAELYQTLQWFPYLGAK